MHLYAKPSSYEQWSHTRNLCTCAYVKWSPSVTNKSIIGNVDYSWGPFVTVMRGLWKKNKQKRLLQRRTHLTSPCTSLYSLRSTRVQIFSWRRVRLSYA